MKRQFAYALMALSTACSGGGSSSSNQEAPEVSGDDFYQLVAGDHLQELHLLENDGDSWRDPDGEYFISITESSNWDSGLQDSIDERLVFSGERDEENDFIIYQPEWSWRPWNRQHDWSAWGTGVGFDTVQIDTFSYEVRNYLGGGELVHGPVEVTIELRPQFYVADLEDGGDDSNPGTRDEPLATVTRALELARPGSVIQICNRGALSEASGETFPWIIGEGVLLRGNGDTMVSGYGEYFSQSMQDALNASIVLAGRSSVVSGLNLLAPEGGDHSAGVFLEGSGHVLASTQVRGFYAGVYCRSMDGVLIESVQVNGGRFGIDAEATLRRSFLRNSGITDCSEIGVLLKRPNDLDLGTQDAPGMNWIARNGTLGLAWFFDVPGAIQDAYGNEWNEYPLAPLEPQGNDPSRYYDVLSGQEPHIDSRGGSSHDL